MSRLHPARLEPTRAAAGGAAAVVGVVLFSSVAPDNFAVFDRAFLTLFYVTGGDPWPDELPKFNEDGTANWVVAAYIMGYTMIELWVILQARRAFSPPALSRGRRLALPFFASSFPSLLFSSIPLSSTMTRVKYRPSRESRFRVGFASRRPEGNEIGGMRYSRARYQFSINQV